VCGSILFLPSGLLSFIARLDYEQQRLHLLHKHGIDLELSNGISDRHKTRRMTQKDVDLIMGGGEGQGGLFTWRDKNRRKVAPHFSNDVVITDRFI